MLLRKTTKRFCIFLVLLLSAFTCYANPVLKNPVTFYIEGFNSLQKKPVSLTLEWNEEWFCKQSTTVYNHNIARIACTLSELSYTDVLLDKNNNYLVLGYKALGVPEQNIELHYDLDYSNSQKDLCAFSFASKQIKCKGQTKNLIFIVIRGTPNKTEEWISNLNISDSTQETSQLHEGFLNLAKDIEKALDLYLNKNKIDSKESILLITGHSRGAATANILSAYFADSQKFDSEKIYSYTFASPNVTTRDSVTDKKYSFIWNIINAEDIVPTVPLNRDKWTYKKFGNTLTLVNYWNVNQEVYNKNIYPKVNDIYKKIQGKDYNPFRTGPFVPIQTTMIFNSFYKDVNKYYSSFFSLRKNAEKLLTKTISTEDKSEEENEPKESFASKIFNMIDSKTDNLFSYVKEAFVDMHANETYLSFLLALEEKESFSTVGCHQIILSGYDEGAILSKDGEVLLQFIDGRVIFSSIKLPIAGWNIEQNKIAIGFPESMEADFILTCNAIIPSRIPIEIEHFDSAGVLISSHKNQVLYPNKSLVYKFDVGKNAIGNTKILAEEIAGKEARELIEQIGIREVSTRKIMPEFSLDNNFKFRYGVHIGNQNVYASLLFGHNVFNIQDSFELSPGIGMQQMLVQSLCLDAEAFLKFVFFVPEEFEKYIDFNVIPSLRLSLSVRPFRRVKIFASGVLDFDIQKGSFFSQNLVSKKDSVIHFNDYTDALPSLQFGIRF